MHRLAFFYGFECPLDPSFVLIVGWSRITRVSKVDRTRSNIEYDISSWHFKIGFVPHATSSLDEVSVLSDTTPYQTKALKSRMITMMTQRLWWFISKVVSDSHLVYSLFDWLYVIYHMLWKSDRINTFTRTVSSNVAISKQT